MEVEIVNDGPVTVQLELPNSEKYVLEKPDEVNEINKT